MRNQIVFFINGILQRVEGLDVLLSLSDYLRRNLRLTGTKIVCSEGDCGACSVLLADLMADQLAYRSIDSCIAFLFQLDGCHVVTVEGLGTPRDLHPVQQAMVDCHGSQCGFCTPGFVVAVTGVMEAERNQACETTTEEWRQALTGNLCRCTGYTSILTACHSLSQVDYTPIAARFPTSMMLSQYAALAEDEVQVVVRSGDQIKHIISPTSIGRVTELRSEFPEARLIAGGTDMGVLINKRGIAPDVMIDLRRVPSLQSIDVSDEAMEVGSGVTWTALLPILEQRLPSFAEIVRVFGSPQIRNMGTLGGNIANASPIADCGPLLHVLDCELTLASSRGTRVVNINNFYTGYKQLDLQNDELISKVRIPLPKPDANLQLFKVSRRRDMDISTFTAAIFTETEIESDQITVAKIAFGAVGPTVVRLTATEKFLLHKPLTLETMRAAGELAVSEIKPISDVRGSADYRLQLARNMFLKYFYRSQLTAAAN